MSDTTDNWQIDTNVPVGRTSSASSSKNARTYHKMNFGDSVFFQDKDEATRFYQYINSQRLRNNREDVTAVMRKNEDGYRIWKQTADWLKNKPSS